MILSNVFLLCRFGLGRFFREGIDCRFYNRDFVALQRMMCYDRQKAGEIFAEYPHFYNGIWCGEFDTGIGGRQKRSICAYSEQPAAGKAD